MKKTSDDTNKEPPKLTETPEFKRGVKAVSISFGLLSTLALIVAAMYAIGPLSFVILLALALFSLLVMAVYSVLKETEEEKARAARRGNGGFYNND
jgi:archaellum biogenesis protein FlaJ (TadC family)